MNGEPLRDHLTDPLFEATTVAGRTSSSLIFDFISPLVTVKSGALGITTVISTEVKSNRKSFGLLDLTVRMTRMISPVL
jgi:hypothetical protein